MSFSLGVCVLRVETGTGTEIAQTPFDEQSDAIATDNPESDILNWAITLGYLDFLGEGNQLGLVMGQLPQGLASHPPIHEELSYKIQMQDHLSITPGLVDVTHPETLATPTVTDVVRSTFKL